jgi:aryl-alcohol dehydrogenase-like predicted oxidoreductase
MEHVRFGRTGLFVSRLCIGGGTFGLHSDEADARDVLDEAADAGITFIDTADAYPLGGTLETVGRSEEMIGSWLAGRRGRFILATKVQARMGPNAWDTGTSRKHVLDAIDGSLRRLRTDYVDLYQIHNPDPNTPIDETLEALDAVVRAGKARYVGCSNFLAYQAARALGRSEARGLVRFSSVQPRYNLLFRQIERELLPLCKEEGLAVIPYNPLAGGLLTGKHDRSRPPATGRFTVPMYHDRYWHDREFDTVDALRDIARVAGTDMVTMAVAWILANKTVTSVILGASKPRQLAPAIAALASPIDPELKTRLDALTVEYRWGDPPVR